MNTPDTITSRIYAKADSELKAEIESHLAAIFAGFDYNGNIPHEAKSLTNADFKDMWWWKLRNAVAELAFNARSPKQRGAALTDFMSKVEAVQDIIGYQEAEGSR